MVELSPVTKDNFAAIINLEVSQDQQQYVASNLYSIAESKVYPECVPLGIYAKDKPVGFLMYAFNQEDGSYWVARLMIDRYFQGKGYGKAALELAIEQLKNKPICNHVKLSIEPGNHTAEKIYASLGFKKTSEIVDGEEVMRLDFPLK